MMFWRHGVHFLGPFSIYTGCRSTVVIGAAWDISAPTLKLRPAMIDLPVSIPVNLTLVDWVAAQRGKWRLRVMFDFRIWVVGLYWGIEDNGIILGPLCVSLESNEE